MFSKKKEPAAKPQSKPAPTPEPGNATGRPVGQQVIRERNNITYAMAAHSLRVAMLSIAVAILSLIVMIGAITMKSDPKFFAVDPDGRVTQLHPLDHPVLSSNQMVTWTVDNLTNALSIDFLRYREQLRDIEPYFTPEGYAAFLNAYKDSGNLDLVINNRYIVQAILNGTPIITGEGVIRGVYTWRMNIPLQISFHAGARTTNQNVTAQVVVRRVHPNRNQGGLAIHQVSY